MTKLESGAIAPNVALARSRRDRRQRVAPREPNPVRGTTSSSSWRRICRCSNSTPCCSSRSCSISSTMPPNTRRRRRRSAFRAGAAATPSACAFSMKAAAFPPADLEHIFDKFYRAQKTDQVRAGTGLGLAISRGFVEAMHGTIVAANRTDRTGADVHHQPADPARAATPGRRRMSAAPLRVLVVDDEPPIRKLLRMGLDRARLSDPRSAQRQGRARAARRGAGPDHSRSRPARYAGPRAAADDPRPQRKRSHRRACRAAATRPARCRRSISAPTTT